MVYLDNAATTRVCPEAAEAAVHMMTECFGNPSTTYKLGREAKANRSTFWKKRATRSHACSRTAQERSRLSVCARRCGRTRSSSRS